MKGGDKEQENRSDWSTQNALNEWKRKRGGAALGDSSQGWMSRVWWDAQQNIFFSRLHPVWKYFFVELSGENISTCLRVKAGQRENSSVPKKEMGSRRLRPQMTLIQSKRRNFKQNRFLIRSATSVRPNAVSSHYTRTASPSELNLMSVERKHPAVTLRFITVTAVIIINLIIVKFTTHHMIKEKNNE